MKERYSLLVSIALITMLFITNVFAQDYTQLHLPQGAKARLGKGWINDIKFSPDGDQLAVATTIGVWIYDVRTGKEVDFITDICTNETKLSSESIGGANAISYSPDGTILAAAHWDRKIRLWDVSNPHRKRGGFHNRYMIAIQYAILPLLNHYLPLKDTWELSTMLHFPRMVA